ncbi:MAG TPA: hypothetical protein VGC41_25140 [Kofleriaceae bacterium]
MNKPPVIAIAALLAAAALVFAAFSSKWLANSGTAGSISMGLLSTTECGVAGIQMVANETDCVTTGNAAYNDAWKEANQPNSSTFAVAGKITLVAMLVAALGLTGAGLLGFKKTKPQLPISPSSIALLGLMISFISGCVFVATKPGPNGLAGVSLSFVVFGAAGVLGLFVAIQLSKLNRPTDPDLLDDAMNPDNF